MWNDTFLPSNDRYYDPPEGDMFGPCDVCQGVFDNDDLVHIKNGADDLWLCPDCEENYWLRINMELESQDDNFNLIGENEI